MAEIPGKTSHEYDKNPQSLGEFVKQNRQEKADFLASAIDNSQAIVEDNRENFVFDAIRTEDFFEASQIYAVLESYKLPIGFRDMGPSAWIPQNNVEVVVTPSSQQFTQDILTKLSNYYPNAFLQANLNGMQINPYDVEHTLTPDLEDIPYEAIDIPLDDPANAEAVTYQQNKQMKRQVMTSAIEHYARADVVENMRADQYDEFQTQEAMFAALYADGHRPFSLAELAEMAQNDIQLFIDESPGLKSLLEEYRDFGPRNVVQFMPRQWNREG